MHSEVANLSVWLESVWGNFQNLFVLSLSPCNRDLCGECDLYFQTLELLSQSDFQTTAELHKSKLWHRSAGELMIGTISEIHYAVRRLATFGIPQTDHRYLRDLP